MSRRWPSSPTIGAGRCAARTCGASTRASRCSTWSTRKRGTDRGFVLSWAMPIERIASFCDLLNLLTETNTPHRADVDRQVVEIPTAVPPLNGPLVARWEKNLPYVQIIHPVVEAVPAARRADVIDAICRANNAIPLPGFGYHYDLHFVYMRLCVPMYEEGMLSTSFRKQLASVVS